MSRIGTPPALIVITMALLALTGCRPAAPPTPTPEPPTDTPTSFPRTAIPSPVAPTDTPEATPTLAPEAKVIQAWHDAWSRGDLEAFMALVADDAVLDRGPNGVITGVEAIRAVVMQEMEEGLKARVGEFEVVGDRVSYHYEVYLGGKLIGQGEGVAIVRDGKIVSDLPAP